MMSILGQIFGPSDAISYAGTLPDDVPMILLRDTEIRSRRMLRTLP